MIPYKKKVQKSEAEKPKVEKPKTMKKIDISTLGERIVSKIKLSPVVVGKTDLGHDEITMKNVPYEEKIVQPILNLEEATNLEMSFGEQKWYEYPETIKPGFMTCSVKSRRFLLSVREYNQLRGK